MQTAAHAQQQKSARAGAARERQVAERFAPVFRQALGDHPRADYLTNFDFDGDWRGDNNWKNADDPRFRLRAYVYFAASETATHFYAHYAVFHPRDYKGGSMTGPLLSGAIREGVRRGGKYDPTGLSSEAVLAHENDMEGCLVVAEKEGEDPARARVILVETLAHDRFLKYAPEGASAPAILRACTARRPEPSALRRGEGARRPRLRRRRQTGGAPRHARLHLQRPRRRPRGRGA